MALELPRSSSTLQRVPPLGGGPLRANHVRCCHGGTLERDEPTVAQARRAIRENIDLVALAASFKWLDNPAADVVALLARQAYDAEASACRYLVLFFEYDDSTRWLLVDDLNEIDLADQVAAGELTAPTVTQIRIRHPGERPFVRGEHARLEKAVEDDLRFDFDEEALSIEFARYPIGLQVMLEDHR